MSPELSCHHFTKVGVCPHECAQDPAISVVLCCKRSRLQSLVHRSNLFVHMQSLVFVYGNCFIPLISSSDE